MNHPTFRSALTRAALLGLLTLAVLRPLAHSQSTVYWDGDGGGAQSGGAGTWNTTFARWASTSGGSTYSTWVSGNIAVFNGTNNGVTVTTPITVGGIQFKTTGYALLGTGAISFTGARLSPSLRSSQPRSPCG